MDEWMDELIDGWVNGQFHVWMDGRTDRDRERGGQIDGQMNEWNERCVDEWIDVQLDGQNFGWIDGSANGWTSLYCMDKEIDSYLHAGGIMPKHVTTYISVCGVVL